MELKSGYKEINVRVYMSEVDEMMVAVFVVPCHVDEQTVYENLISGHRKMSKNGNAIYEEMGGKEPRALYNYVCEETGWSWRIPSITYHVDINLD